jgi:nitroimidazol reductase NimA-like FMN-containing flavoprotein (pyridoxamine 5'-phosphate oxidase superfamily)
MRRSDREINDTAAIDDILSRADVCHLALVDQGEPYLVTLNFGFTRQSGQLILYFHSANEGRKLDIIRKNQNVCFALDLDHVLVKGGNGCGWGMKYKSVVGYGRMEITTDPEERLTGLQCLMEHYSSQTEFVFDPQVLSATTVLKLTADRVTGKKKA